MYIISSKSHTAIHTHNTHESVHITVKRYMHAPRSTGGGIKMRDLLSKYQFIKSKMQPYNLKRLPTEAKFTSNESRSFTKM